MIRPINLDLLSALEVNKNVKVPTTSRKNTDYTVEDATGFWIRKHRGTGWLVATIEITTSLQVVFEHSLEKVKRANLGLINENKDTVQQISTHPKALVIAELDSLTPEWLVQTVQYMSSMPDSKLLILECKGW